MTRRKERRPAKEQGRSAPAQPTARPRLPGINRWIALAICLVALAAYFPALGAPFVLDDGVTVDASAHWEAPAGMPTAGRPLVMATLAMNGWINRTLGVDERPDPDGPHKAVGFRLVNLLLHLLTGALLFALIRRAMRESPIPNDWQAIADPVAGIVSTLWILHPIQSEVINYVVQRSEGLASLFYVLTLYASQRAWDAASESRTRWYALAVAAAVLGMLSKEIVITVPLAVMLYDRAFRLPSWRALVEPGDGRGWLYGALAVACAGTFAFVALGVRGGTPELNEGVTWYSYLYTQGWAIAHYLRLAVWPAGFSPDYGFRTVQGARAIPGIVLLTALAALVLIAWTRVARFGWFAFTGSMFFILLAPSSSVVPVVLEIAAERRIYLALATVMVLGVVGAEWLRRRFAARLPAQRLVAVAGAVAALLAITTGMRSRAYAEPEALWRDAVKAVPENSRAFEQLGLTLLAQRPPRPVEAESAFVRAMAIDTSCQSGCLQYGTLLTQEGRFREALPLLERQASQGAGTRYNFLAMRLLAYDRMKLGDYNGALPLLERIVQLDPKLSHFVALGVAYLTVGRTDEAVATFRHMATFDPGNPELQRLSGRLEDGTHHPEALANLQEFAFQMAQDWM